MRAPLLGAGVGVALVVGGGAGVALSATQYLDTPYDLNSASGMVVFRLGDALAQYPDWEPGFAAVAIGCGMLVLTASVLAAAIGRSQLRPDVY